MACKEKWWLGMGISTHRFRELSCFCLQYSDWSREIKELAAIGERDSNRFKALAKKLRIVHLCAESVGEDWAPIIIGAVCEGRPFWSVKGHPVERGKEDGFFIARKMFFAILNQVKD